LQASSKGECRIERIGLLAIAHGSSSREHVQTIQQLVRGLLNRLSQFNAVAAYEIAYMGSRKGLRGISEALRELSTKCEKIVVLPVFLTPGKHVTSDVPREIGISNCKSTSKYEIEIDGRHITLVYANPIGFDERIVDVLYERFKEAYSSLKGKS